MGAGLAFFIISLLVRFDFLIMCMYYFNKSKNFLNVRKAQRKKKKPIANCTAPLILPCNTPQNDRTASRQTDFTWK